MEVHLIKSAEVGDGLFVKVIHFLQSIPGPISFFHEEQVVSEFEKDEVFAYQIRDRKHFEEKLMSFNVKESAEMNFPFDRETASWDALFNKAANYRKKKNIASDAFVILLTEIGRAHV